MSISGTSVVPYILTLIIVPRREAFSAIAAFAPIVNPLAELHGAFVITPLAGRYVSPDY